ncbi:capsid maturation protease [Gordonia phage PCoral7]|uniref:Capsid maturation protease n=1 Tax=Gordonia phage Toast TaxID=2599852 RepID=A0A5J6TBY0_9CAUD|nr:head maturation protease [Gordonia phage Toast]QFG08065.1 capsid maturation protease [Gordonia phage Toast]UVF60512.1 capsid maturation protease [Gordonia phage PCoral7]
MVEVLSTPVLATIPRVELGSVGTWDISNIAGWHPTAEDFASAVAALDCPAVRRPVLKPGHSDGPGDPTIGLVDNLAIADDGQTLVGDFVGVPAWLAAADSEGRSVIASAYADRSGEWEHNYVCQLGHTHPFVLHAVALLGVERPGIGTLESLYDLYAKAPTKKEIPMAAAALASVTVDQVRAAYYNGPAASNYNLWIREMLVDPPQLIVQNDVDSTLLKVPFSVTDSEVTFGEPVKVTVEYVDSTPVTVTPEDGEAEQVAASARVVRFASRAESRPGRPAEVSKPAAAADGEPTEGGSGVEITNEQLAALRTALGLADDVDIDGIIAAAEETAKKANEETTDTSAGTPDGQQAAASAGAGLPDGVVAIDAGRLATLEQNSARFAEHLENERKASIEQRLNSAISEGRITPAHKETWRKSFDQNPESAAELLASMAPNSAVPVSELGHSTEPADISDVREDPAYKNWSI